MSTGGRHSGVQLQVLSLYKSLLRIAQSKQPSLIPHIRQQFFEHAQWKKTDTEKIEYEIRRGKKQLETFKQPGVKTINFIKSSH